MGLPQVLSRYYFCMLFCATVLVFFLTDTSATAITNYTLTPYWWEESYTYYQLGSTVTSKGQSWVDASRKSAGKWSNHHSNDVGVYGITPLTSNFYFTYVSPYNGSQYDHTLGFSDLATGTLGLTILSGAWEDGWNNGVDNYYIRFNTDYQWTADTAVPSDKYCYNSIAVHEFGHALGLGHPVGNKYDWDDATRPSMYGYYGLGEIWARTLAQGDRDGVMALYGPH